MNRLQKQSRGNLEWKKKRSLLGGNDLVWGGRCRRQGPGQCPPRPWREGTYCIQNEQKINKQGLTNKASNFFTEK